MKPSRFIKRRELCRLCGRQHLRIYTAKHYRKLLEAIKKS